MTARTTPNDDGKPLTMLRVLNEFRDWLQAEHNPLGGRVDGCPKCEKLKELDKLIERTFAQSESTRTFSDFIRNATPEEKEAVYTDVMKRATERQSEPSPADKQHDDLPAALDYVRRVLLQKGYNHCETDAKIIQEAIDRLTGAPSAGAELRTLAERCRPAVAHDAKLRDREQYSDKYAAHYRPTLKAEAERAAQLLDDIDAIIAGSPRSATLATFIVCLTKLGRRVVLAVYADDEADARRKALGRYTGFSIERIVKKDTPAVFRIHDDAWFDVMADDVAAGRGAKNG